MKRNVLGALALAAIVVGCTADNAEAIRALETNGFTDVTVTDSSVFAWGCGKDDAVRYDCNATNPRGQRVDVTVCCGGPLGMKGCTVRTR